MAPYRTVEREHHAEAPRDAGIVGDVIAQFADQLAFYRELVQNAIDAGSPSIEVRLDHDGPAGVMRATVRDRGEGMTREIVEEQLLVLFRSSKEGATGKIGKFGIGFASVLAPSPNVVVVQTSRDGRRLILHLQRDLSYQLFDGGPATQTGTSVELEIPMPPDDAPRFVEQSIAALQRWCRHATVPIQLVSSVEPARELRIDQPLALGDAVVEVRREVDGLTALVGLTASGAPYSGFFNHGLMLFETSEPLAGRVAFKIQDAQLGHTLSRDNVRRDARFDFAMATVRDLVATELVGACGRALEEAATHGDRTRYFALVLAIGAAELAIPAAAWTYPLVDAIDGKRSVRGSELPKRVYACDASNEITKLLAAGGRPVLDLADAGAQAAVKRSLGERVVDVRSELTLVAPVELSERDHALIGALHAQLEAAYRAPPAIVLARLDGARAFLLSLPGGQQNAVLVAPDGRQLFDLEIDQKSPFARLVPAPLVLSIDHAHVRAARAADDPRLAASHLARTILVSHRALDAARSETILQQTLGQLGVGR